MAIASTEDYELVTSDMQLIQTAENLDVKVFAMI
jgi:hypothetical protein